MEKNLGNPFPVPHITPLSLDLSRTVNTNQLRNEEIIYQQHFVINIRKYRINVNWERNVHALKERK